MSAAQITLNQPINMLFLNPIPLWIWVNVRKQLWTENIEKQHENACGALDRYWDAGFSRGHSLEDPLMLNKLVWRFYFCWTFGIAAAVNCDAKWTSSNCTKACGGGSRTEKYVVKTASAGTGVRCNATNGTTRTFACNTNACGFYISLSSHSSEFKLMWFLYCMDGIAFSSASQTWLWCQMESLWGLLKELRRWSAQGKVRHCSCCCSGWQSVWSGKQHHSNTLLQHSEVSRHALWNFGAQMRNIFRVRLKLSWRFQ